MRAFNIEFIKTGGITIPVQVSVVTIIEDPVWAQLEKTRFDLDLLDSQDWRYDMEAGWDDFLTQGPEPTQADLDALAAEEARMDAAMLAWYESGERILVELSDEEIDEAVYRDEQRDERWR